MKKRLTVTKVTRVLKVSGILRDILSDMSDEELLDKYSLSWIQLEKIYTKLYYGGYLSKEELVRRVELRYGQDSSHIPLADLECADAVYSCEICGFASPLHFSACPRCRQLNLRRLTRRPPSVVVSSDRPVHYAGT